MTQNDNRKPLIVALCSLIVSFCIAAPAFAQAARSLAADHTGVVLAQTQTGVDFTPIVSNAWTFIVAVLTIAAGFISRALIGWLSSKTKLSDNQFEALLAQRADDILHKAIANANMYVKEQLADPNSAVKNVRIDNMWMRMAAQYANRSMPDIIKYFGWTAEDVADKIKTRLDSYVSVPQENSGIVEISS